MFKSIFGCIAAVVCILGMNAGENAAVVLYRAETELSIPCKDGEKSSSRWKFPGIQPRAGYTPVLVFDGGIDFSKPRGWSYMMELQLNGRRITGFEPNGAVRLLERGNFLVNKLEKKRPWWSGCRLLTLYGPVGKQLHNAIVSPRETGYTYRIVVGDLLYPDKENQLEIFNFLTPKAMKSANGAALKIANLRLELVSDAEVAKMRAFDPVSRFIAESVRENSAFRAEPLFKIKCLPDAKTSRTIDFPAVKRVPGTVEVLAFDAWLYTPSPSGWNGYLNIRLNGRELSRYTGTGEERLLRRGDRMTTTFPKQPVRPWWEGNTLLMLFGPGCGPVDQRIISPREEGYTYYIDISDVVNTVRFGPDNRIEQAETNQLTLVNNLTEKHLAGRPSFMGIRNLRVVRLPLETVNQFRNSKLTKWESCSEAVPALTRDGITLKVAAGGGFEISCFGDQFRLAGAFSYPAQPEMKYNEFSVSDRPSGESSWKPEISVSDNTITVTACGKLYQVRRILRHNSSFLELVEQVTNHSKQDLGVRYLLNLLVPGKVPNDQVHFGGVSKTTYADGIGDNPTLFVPGKSSGLGIMAYDDIFRNHLKIFRKNANTFSMVDENTALRPGETLEWKSLIFPVGNPDYFDFLNALRRKLGRLQTIPYSSVFSQVEADPRFHADLLAPEPWFEWTIRGGKLYTRDEYAALMKKAREANPNTRIIGRLETNIVAIDKRNIPGGMRLPASLRFDSKGNRHYGKYGTVCSPEQTEILLKHCPFADSLIFTADRRVLVDGYYSAEPRLNLLVQVEENNYRCRNIMEQIDFLIEKIGLDGVYMDQFEAGCTGSITRADRCSYDRWDGRSVDLDKTGNISRKFYDYAIMGISGREKIVRRVTDRGKIFLSNNHPTSERIAVLPAFHFHEFEFYPVHQETLANTGEPETRYILGKCQLSNSPLTLGIRPSSYSRDVARFGEIIQKAVIIALRHGVLYYCYHAKIDKDSAPGILNWMYPITPVELGKGFIIGKERILTAVSRDFTVPSKPSTVKFFNLKGQEIPGKADLEKRSSSWIVKLRLKDWNETAVIVFEPQGKGK